MEPIQATNAVELATFDRDAYRQALAARLARIAVYRRRADQHRRPWVRDDNPAGCSIFDTPLTIGEVVEAVTGSKELTASERAMALEGLTA